MAAINAADLADAAKFTTIGLTFGVLAGGATEIVADAVVGAIGLADAHPVSDEERAGKIYAELIVRGVISGLGFVVSERLMSYINTRRDDVTQGGYFSYAFMTVQGGLYKTVLAAGDLVTKGDLLQLGSGSSPTHGPRGGKQAPPCCGDCAISGGSCTSK